MGIKIFSSIGVLFTFAFLAACGPSAEELAATSHVETAVSLAATQTARPTETPNPTATCTPTPTDTPTITPIPTKTDAPSLTPTPEPVVVYGNLQVSVVPFDERAEVPDPLGDLTLIFRSESEEEFTVIVTDNSSDFSIQLPDGSYTLDLVINAIDTNLITGSLSIQVPDEGCIYIGKVTFSYNRLPPLSIVDQMGLAQSFAGVDGVSFTFMNEGNMVHLSTEMDVPGEGEWAEGSESCLVQLPIIWKP